MKVLSFFLITFMTFFTGELNAKPAERGVAIVVDPVTWDNCKNSIENYMQSVKADGLNPILLIDKWGIPDSIRTNLYKLYKESNIEGAVLIGDIPVPMIRNAQHLTTAFKMDQRRAWERSSVPSDRFYDDFDLKFEYIKRDSTYTNYFYYNLAADSPHRIECDIYSARIKPPKVPGKDKYTLISEFLNKAAKEKQQKREIKSLTYFAGHGYNSNCMVSRADERLSLTEQFKVLKDGKGTLTFIDFTFDDFIKFRLMSELSREDLDLAILHHHGSEDEQILNGSSLTNMPNRWIDMTKKFFRSKIRGADDTTASKQYYIDNYNVPESWVENAFNPEYITKDSIDDASMGILIPDLYGYKPGARVIIIDACFNGSFHLDDYISGHYIFGEGKTMVVKANSVNTLQDTWTNQLVGILDFGVSVGNWSKGQMTLESHLIGDPTYRYTSSRKETSDINEMIVNGKTNEKYWRKNINSTIPEMKALSMKMLYGMGKISSDEMLQIQTNDASPVVRMQAFYLINKRFNANVVKSLKAGLYDNYELIRRMSAKEASTNLSPELLDDIFKIRYAPGTSKRVEFQLKSGCESFGKEEALAAFAKYADNGKDQWYMNRAQERKMLEYSLGRTEKEMSQLMDPSVAARSKRFTITALRNLNNVAYLDTLFKFLKESDDNELRETLAEAFAWYTNSSKKYEIVKALNEQLKIEKDLKVKNEIIRTINRLQD